MIDKKRLLQNISVEEDRLLVARIFDYLKRKGISQFFLNPAQQQLAYRYFSNDDDYHIRMWGGYDDAERKVISFCSEFEKDADFPITVLSITTKADLFISHRDVLGAVMGLGIKREKIGDIVINKDCIYLFCISDIAEYIKDNLTKVASCRVDVSFYEIIEPIKTENSFIILPCTVSSLRHDAVLAVMFHVSRAKAQQMIQADRVMVNHQLISKGKAEAKQGDVYSVHGLGRAELYKIGRLTKKGRVGIEVKRYI